MTAEMFSEPFEVTVSHFDNGTVLSVRGEVDLVTAPMLTESVDAVLGETPTTALIVDLTDVPFFASVGMSILVDAGRRAADTGSFAVVAAGPSTARPLALIGLDATFDMYTDLDSAIAALTL